MVGDEVLLQQRNGNSTSAPSSSSMSLSSERCRLWRDIKVVNANGGGDDDDDCWGEIDNDGSASSSSIAVPRGVFVDLVRALLQPSSIISDSSSPPSSSVIDGGDEDGLALALANGLGAVSVLIPAKTISSTAGAGAGRSHDPPDASSGGYNCPPGGGGDQQGTLGALLARKMLHSQGC
jgi:hypothetical protein